MSEDAEAVRVWHEVYQASARQWLTGNEEVADAVVLELFG